MSALFLQNEGFALDDLDNLIYTIYVDLRDEAERSPIGTLVKACERQYAIEHSRQVRISKPSRFRKWGEDLIRDPGEARFSHEFTESQPERQLPTFLPKLPRIPDTDLDALLKQLPPDMRPHFSEANNITEKLTETLTFGRNGWIFCVSMAQTKTADYAGWRDSLPEEYDHQSFIYRPRTFARALGMMLAEQIGAQGREEELKQSYDEIPSPAQRFKTQLVFHGPVIYVDDPHRWVTNVSSRTELLYGFNFVKHTKYREQREYRFVMLAEEEPVEEVVDLHASYALLGAMNEKLPNTIGQVED